MPSPKTPSEAFSTPVPLVTMLAAAMASEICFWLSDICCLVRINRPRSEPLRVNKSGVWDKGDNNEGLLRCFYISLTDEILQLKLTGSNRYRGPAVDLCLCHLSWDWCKEEQTLDLSDCRAQQRCQTIPSDPSCFGCCGRNNTTLNSVPFLRHKMFSRTNPKSHLLTLLILYSMIKCFQYTVLVLKRIYLTHSCGNNIGISLYLCLS